MAVADGTLTGLLKLLSDPTRLRILGLIEHEELAVGELSRALSMTQSRVSNHLRLLRDGGLISERHDGTSVYLRLAPLRGATNGQAVVGRLWETLSSELVALPEHSADLVRLERVLAERAGGGAEFFDQKSREWDKIALDFETGQARERLATHLLPSGWRVADLGCGTGYLAQALLGQISRLICVDHSGGMLEQAEKRLARAPRGTEIELRQGRLDALPIADDEVDGCVAGLVLHHLPELDPALQEMRRIVRPGGSAVVLELAPHRETWMRERMGDHHLGLDSSDVLAAFRSAGFEEVVLDPVRDRYQPHPPEGEAPSLELYLVRGRVPTEA